jgi:hypothetical protein
MTSTMNVFGMDWISPKRPVGAFDDRNISLANSSNNAQCIVCGVGDWSISVDCTDANQLETRMISGKGYGKGILQVRLEL